jgi:methylated-DNA-[protein]-cysteine S-methyltransferase
LRRPSAPWASAAKASGCANWSISLPHYEEKAPQDALSEQAAVQVTRYFEDADFRFDLPLFEAGSPFQRRVWEQINAIPRGSVRTYGQVAKLLESHPRAVGQACGANWFPLVIPCHRVTAAAGLGGFANSATTKRLSIGRQTLAAAPRRRACTDMPWQQQSIFL